MTDHKAKAREELGIELSQDEIDGANEALMRYGFDTDELSPEEAVAKAARIEKAKTRAAQVLSRGRTLDALDGILREVPKGQVGQIVRENPTDIARYEALGFEMASNKKAGKASPHGTGDNRVRVGDSVLMTIDQEEHVALGAAKDERRASRRSRDPKTQARNEIEGIGVHTY